MNKNLMIGLGVLAVAGIGLYMYNKRKSDSEKKSSALGAEFDSSNADGETDDNSEDVRDCGCKYKDTDDSTVFSIARPKYSNALGKFSPRITDGGVLRQKPDEGTICRYSDGTFKGNIGQACQTTDASGNLCNGKLTRAGDGAGCDCTCPVLKQETGNQPTRYIMPRKRRF